MNLTPRSTMVHGMKEKQNGFEPMSNKMFGMPGGIMETYSYPTPVVDHVLYIDDLEDCRIICLVCRRSVWLSRKKAFG